MNKKKAFVLMPFATEFSDVYEHFIRESLVDSGYVVRRADDIKSQNNIISDIVEGIVNSDLIICDLTGSNPNVYYELGIAHALNKNVILITQEIGELPFDLRSYRVVGYSTFFSKMTQARKELKELAIEAFNGSLPFGNPVKDFGNVEASFTPVTLPVNESEAQSNEEDLGLLDYLVMLEEGLENLVEIVTEVGGKLEIEVTPEITKSGEKLSSGKFTTKQRINIFRELASHLQKYAAFVKPKNENYRLKLKDVETGLENMLGGNYDYAEESEREGLQKFLDVLAGVETSALEGRQGIASLVDTMEALPKIEKNFNRANTFMASELKTFVDNIDQTISAVSRAGRLGSRLTRKQE